MKRQQLLLKTYSHPIVCLLCNIPGPVKRCALSHALFTAGLYALRTALQAAGYALLHEESACLHTGPEAYFVVEAPARALKACCCALENTHPLGRLWDVDVIDLSGVPLSRTGLGEPPRRCLVCDEPARLCMRRQPHTLTDVQAAIWGMVRQSGLIAEEVLEEVLEEI